MAPRRRWAVSRLHLGAAEVDGRLRGAEPQSHAVHPVGGVRRGEDPREGHETPPGPPELRAAAEGHVRVTTAARRVASDEKGGGMATDARAPAGSHRDGIQRTHRCGRRGYRRPGYVDHSGGVGRGVGEGHGEQWYSRRIHGRRRRRVRGYALR